MDNEACIEGLGLLLRSSNLDGFFVSKIHLGLSSTSPLAIYSFYFFGDNYFFHHVFKWERRQRYSVTWI